VLEGLISIVSVVLALAVLLLLLLISRRGSGRSDAASLARFDVIERGLEKIERGLRDEIGRNRDETAGQAHSLRGEISTTMHSGADHLRESILAIGNATEQRLETMRQTVDERLQTLQQQSAEKLDQMRRTVDNQLQGTLEKRLGESFKLVSNQLEQVHQGLGEMQTLAAGVGDLKKVLSNVRARGTWGEIQLGALLEDILHHEQYARNVATTNTAERVEFAVSVPCPGTESHVWLPIDAKFPQEDYLRLIDAAERGNAVEIETCSKHLEQRIRACARDIRDKYVSPPATTEFAIMYLPTEGLYAEVLRRPGLVEGLQRETRVVVAGPTTLAAILNSLRMGFQTLNVQKRTDEVWRLLASIKTEFASYDDALQKVQKKLQQAANTVDKELRHTRDIQRRLKQVEIPEAADETQQLTDGQLQSQPAEPPVCVQNVAV
jgi:DNA recombination protein RmuC